MKEKEYLPTVVPTISTNYDEHYQDPCDFKVLELERITGRWRYVGKANGTVLMQKRSMRL